MENNNNLTARVIVSEINGYRFKGDTLGFLASFLGYCNDRTTFGVPRKCCPFDDDILCEFGKLTVRVSDAAIEPDSNNGVYLAFYTIEQTDEEYTVCVTSYWYDEEYDEISPSLYCTPTFATFDITAPRDLEELCDCIGVTFSPSFFE